MGDNRRIRHLRRGSALVYTSMLMVAITTVVVTTSQLNAAASGKAERQIDAVMTEESENGAVAYVSAMCNAQSINLPATYNLTLNGQTQTVSVTDNNSTLARSIKVATVVNGKHSRNFERVLAGRQTPSPTYYALWLGRATDLSSSRLRILSGGHTYCRNNLTLSATSTLDGEVVAAGIVTTNGATVVKNVVSGARNTAAPAFDNSDYLTAVLGLVSTPGSINSLSFLTLGLGLPYQLRYYRGDTLIKGKLEGKGTVYFEDDVIIENDVEYKTASDRVVFIVEGNLTIQINCKRLDGIWIVKGNVSVEPDVSPLILQRGSLTVMNRLELTRDLDITPDTTFWTDRNEGVRHRAPGFWPTPLTGLLR